MRKLLTYLFLFITLSLGGQQITPGIIASSASNSGGTPPAGSSLLTGLMLWYDCNESSGNIIDASGNNYTGIPTAVTYGQAGIAGNSLNFNGTTSLITIGSNYTGFPKPTTALTIAFGLKTSSATDNLKWLYTSGTGSCGIRGYYYGSDGTFSMYLGDSGGTNGYEFQTVSGGYGNGTFHYVIFTFDGSVVNCWVDGVQKITNQSWVHTINWTNVPDMTLMANNYGTQFIPGNLDKFGIWNRAITSDERTTLTNGTYPW